MLVKTFIQLAGNVLSLMGLGKMAGRVATRYSSYKDDRQTG